MHLDEYQCTVRVLTGIPDITQSLCQRWYTSYTSTTLGITRPLVLHQCQAASVDASLLVWQHGVPGLLQLTLSGAAQVRS